MEVSTTKTRHFDMRMSAEDFDELDAQSVKTGLSKSELIRRAWKKLHVTELPSADFLLMARELRRIGTNLNQLTKLANVRGYAGAPSVRAALDDVIDVDRKIRNLLGGESK